MNAPVFTFGRYPRNFRHKVNIPGCSIRSLLSGWITSSDIKSALVIVGMEGFRVPASVVRDGKRVLDGKVTADELVQQYKSRYRRN